MKKIDVIVVNEPTIFDATLDTNGNVVRGADGLIRVYPQLAEEPCSYERV